MKSDEQRKVMEDKAIQEFRTAAAGAKSDILNPMALTRNYKEKEIDVPTPVGNTLSLIYFEPNDSS